MTRNKLILSFILVFIVSPVIAYFAAYFKISQSGNTPTLTPPTRTQRDIEQAIRRDRLDLGKNSYPDITVSSFEHTHNNWYIVKGTIKDTPKASPVLLVGDFYNSADKMVLVINPNQSFYRLNTSHDGVPYEVIEKVRSLKSPSKDYHD